MIVYVSQVYQNSCQMFRKNTLLTVIIKWKTDTEKLLNKHSKYTPIVRAKLLCNVNQKIIRTYFVFGLIMSFIIDDR